MALKPQQPPKTARKPAGKSTLANIKALLAAKQAMAMRGRPGAMPGGGVSPSPMSFGAGMGGAAAPTQ